MSLKQNGHEYAAYPTKFTGGFATYIRPFSTKEERNLNRFYSAAGMSRVASIPIGYTHPYTKPPIRGGGMACLVGIIGSGVIAALNLAAGKRGSANIAGTGQFVGSIRARADIIASLAGNGQITTATIVGAVNLIAALFGTGSITSSQLNSVLNAVAALSGSGGIVAHLNAVVDILAAIAGQGGLTANLAGGKYISAAFAGQGLISQAITRGAGNLSANISLLSQEGEVLTAALIASAVRSELLPELADINQVKAFIANRLRINKTTGVWTIYDEDKVTPLFTGLLVDDGTNRDRIPT
jgi:hypothetical protein